MGIKERIAAQVVVCSVPGVVPWYKRWFERKNKPSCIDHDVGYVVRTGPKGGRSFLRYLWDEIKQRRRVDKQFLDNMLLSSNSYLEKINSYLAYSAVRLFGWSYWWWDKDEAMEENNNKNILQRLFGGIKSLVWSDAPVSGKDQTKTILSLAVLYWLYTSTGGVIDTDTIKHYIICNLIGIDCEAFNINQLLGQK